MHIVHLMTRLNIPTVYLKLFISLLNSPKLLIAFLFGVLEVSLSVTGLDYWCVWLHLKINGYICIRPHLGILPYVPIWLPLKIHWNEREEPLPLCVIPACSNCSFRLHIHWSNSFCDCEKSDWLGSMQVVNTSCNFCSWQGDLYMYYLHGECTFIY